MKQRLLFILAGLLFFALFYRFSLYVRQDKFHQLNFDTTVRLQDRMPKRFDSQWEDFTYLAGPEISIVLILAISVLACIDFKKKKLVLSAFLIPLFFFLLVSAEVYGKDRVESPGPPFFMIKNTTTIFPKFHVIEKYSYPSGHASRSLFFGIVLTAIVYRKTRKWQSVGIVAGISVFFVTFISLGKLYLGHHWLSDIIGGYLLATAFGVWFLAAYLPKLSFPNFASMTTMLEYKDEVDKKPVTKVHKQKK